MAVADEAGVKLHRSGRQRKDVLDKGLVDTGAPQEDFWNMSFGSVDAWMSMEEGPCAQRCLVLWFG